MATSHPNVTTDMFQEPLVIERTIEVPALSTDGIGGSAEASAQASSITSVSVEGSTTVI